MHNRSYKNVGKEFTGDASEGYRSVVGRVVAFSLLENLLARASLQCFGTSVCNDDW